MALMTELPKKIEIPVEVLSSFSQGVAIFSTDRRLLYVNPAMAKVTGSDPSRIGGALEKLSEGHRLRNVNGVPLEMKDFPVMRAFEGIETHDEPYIYVDSNNSHVWLSISCMRILGTDGELQYVISTVSDISDKKTSEDKLRFLVESAKILSLTENFRSRMEKKMKLAVPALADWAAVDILTDNDTVERIAVVHQDPAMIDYIFEYEKKYPPKRDTSTSVYSTIKNGTAQYIPIITDEMIVQSVSSPEQADDIRKLRLASIIVVPILLRGKGVGALTLAYAESGRHYSEADFQFFKEYASHVSVLFDNGRLFDEINARDKSKDLFLASLSHELRNPLSPIKSALELLKMKDVSTDVREELTVIEHQFDHMARLLNDLLDVTRFTQARISISRHPTELRKLVERSLRSTDMLMRNADITLHFTYPGTPLNVLADETRMEQAISNLMSNAIKFTPAGGSIWVDLRKSETGASISIRDNGAGISPKDLPNIFDMYYQGQHTHDHENTGLGIGLLLVKKIADLHDGSVEAKSEGPGKGSEFTITIPLAEEAVGPGDTTPASTGPARKRILIVDDNQQAADSLVKLLNKVGANADALYSAEETLAHDLSNYEFILLDIGMPHINGYQLVKMLRQRGVRTPIIALSGYGMEDDKRKAVESGFTAHLTKPIGLKELNAMFDSVSA